MIYDAHLTFMKTVRLYGFAIYSDLLHAPRRLDVHSSLYHAPRTYQIAMEQGSNFNCPFSIQLKFKFALWSLTFIISFLYIDVCIDLFNPSSYLI